MESKRKVKLQSYVTTEDYQQIITSSERAGLSISEFIRRVALGWRVESREDHQARRELLKVNADLGRIGGLLKQALAEGQSKPFVYGLLQQVDQLQALLKEKVKRL